MPGSCCSLLCARPVGRAAAFLHVLLVCANSVDVIHDLIPTSLLCQSKVVISVVAFTWFRSFSQAAATTTLMMMLTRTCSVK